MSQEQSPNKSDAGVRMSHIMSTAVSVRDLFEWLVFYNYPHCD